MQTVVLKFDGERGTARIEVFRNGECLASRFIAGAGEVAGVIDDIAILFTPAEHDQIVGILRNGLDTGMTGEIRSKS